MINGKGEAKGEIRKERGRNRMGGGQRFVCLFKRTARKRKHEWVEGGACLLNGTVCTCIETT